MAKLLEMPKLSPTMTEGQLAVWHKKEGESVAVDDLLAEVETDKATMEFRAFDKGTLLKILVPTGSMVLLGQPVAIMGAPGEDIAALIAKAAEGAPAAAEGAPAAPAPTPARGETGAPPAAESPAPSASAQPSPAARPTSAGATPPLARGDGQPKASPYVRKRAREEGIDLLAITGSGPFGRIVARDLQSTALTAPQAEPTRAVTAVRREDEIRPLSMMRKTIARRLTEAKQTIPHFYLNIDVDAGPLSRLRQQINDDLASAAGDAEGGRKVSLNDLLIKACALALLRVPECNATFTKDALVIHHRVDISVAVAVTDGLVTPVIRDADRKSVLAIAQEVRDLAGKAKKKALKPEEMADGTFSISNLGMFDIDSFSAVINPPEGAILAVGRVRDEPVVWEGAVVAGKRLAMTLSCDHRVVDGAVGARFLAALRTLVERPTQMLVL